MLQTAGDGPQLRVGSLATVNQMVQAVFSAPSWDRQKKDGAAARICRCRQELEGPPAWNRESRRDPRSMLASELAIVASVRQQQDNVVDAAVALFERQPAVKRL